MAGSLHLSRRDLDFMLDEWLDVGSLSERAQFAEHSAETFAAVLDLSEQIATREFAPHNKISDADEPKVLGDGSVQLRPEIGRALKTYMESGLQGSTFPEHLGGMQLPTVVHRAATLWFQATNISTSSYAGLATAAANLLVAHASQEMVQRFAVPIIEGRFYGTMCLSEPQAGSSLADITTLATRTPDGAFRLRGTKMWISAGEHDLGENIVHLVLARTPGATAGVKGISLFIVPKYLVEDDGRIGEPNDVVLVGLNHKMGNRGTTNTLLNFGEGAHQPGGNAGAVGYLIGEEGHGLAYMFSMMNEARIAVGAGAVALGYAGYLHALDYARTRTQGRPPVDRDPSSAQIRIVDHPDVRRMLLAQKAYVEGGLALVLYCARLVDDSATADDEGTRCDAAALLDVLTPVAKSFPSQWCLAANDLAIQVHGGYGYTRDYDVEQYYRDNRLNAIHEGTHGIQGLDLLGRKVTAYGGANFRLLLGKIHATSVQSRALGSLGATYADQLDHYASRLADTTEAMWAAGDPAATLANASLYLEVVGHVVVAWMWLEQFITAHGKDGTFYEGKRLATDYFFSHELPRTTPQLDLLGSLDRLTLDLDETWL